MKYFYKEIIEYNAKTTSFTKTRKWPLNFVDVCIKLTGLLQFRLLCKLIFKVTGSKIYFLKVIIDIYKMIDISYKVKVVKDNRIHISLIM